MNIEITQIQCNCCSAVIAARGQNGAVNFPGTQVDFCPLCSQKTVAAAAIDFKTPPSPPAPAGMKKIRLANGTNIMIPSAAPMPAGATVIP